MGLMDLKVVIYFEVIGQEVGNFLSNDSEENEVLCISLATFL